MVPILFLRLFVGLMGIFFAHFLGRSASRLRRGEEIRGRTITWALRTAVAVGAVLYTGRLDAISTAVLLLAALAAGYGAWRERHPAPQEDLSQQDLFPKE